MALPEQVSRLPHRADDLSAVFLILLRPTRLLAGGGTCGSGFRRAGASVFLGLMLAGAGAMHGAEARQTAQKVKYLLSFTDYVEWPERAFSSSLAPIVIGIIGEDPFGDIMDKQAKEFRGRRRIEVRRFKGMNEFRGGDLPGPRKNKQGDRQKRKDAELRKCHVLYVSRSEDAFVKIILGKVRGGNVLTVGEKQSFARDGGVICLYEDPETRSQLRFEISLRRAEEAKLKISSKLLGLDKAKVIDEPRHTEAEPK